MRLRDAVYPRKHCCGLISVGRITGSKAAKEKMPDQVTVAIIGVVVAAFTGGLSGALVTAIITRRRQRLELALKVVDYFLGIYSDVADVHRYFQENNSLTDRIERNQVKKLGDWFEWVIILAQNGAVDVALLDHAGMLKQIGTFRDNVKVFKTKFETLHSSWESWTNLRNFDRQALLRRSRKLLGG